MSVLWGVIEAHLYFYINTSTLDNTGERVARDKAKTGKDRIIYEDLKGNMKLFAPKKGK